MKNSVKKLIIVGAAVMVLAQGFAAPAMAADPGNPADEAVQKPPPTQTVPANPDADKPPVEPPVEDQGGKDKLPEGTPPAGDKPPVDPPVEDQGGKDKLPGGTPPGAKPEEKKPEEKKPDCTTDPLLCPVPNPCTDDGCGKPSKPWSPGYWKAVVVEYCSCWGDYFKPWYYWDYYCGSCWDYSYGDYYWDYYCGCWAYDYQPWYYWYSPSTMGHNFYGYCYHYYYVVYYKFIGKDKTPDTGKTPKPDDPGKTPDTGGKQTPPADKPSSTV